MSNDSNKPIKNSLFNPRVTGSTYEDFAQHAVLFPAQQSTLPTLHTLGIGQSNSESSNNVTVETHSVNQFCGEIENANVEIPELHQQPTADHHQHSLPNISSLIPSFSSIWRRSPNQQQPAPLQKTTDQHFYLPSQEEGVIFPSGQTSSPEPTSSIPAVSLFSPNDIPKTVPPTPPQTASSNTYRRAGTKRPVYAPIPGLSKPTPEPVPASSPVQFDQNTVSGNQQGFLANYFAPSVSETPAIFIPEPSIREVARPTTSVTPKSFLPTESAKSSESNSPFLSPIQDISIYPSTEPFVAGFASASVPTMPVHEISNPTTSNLPYAYRQDNFLPNSVSEMPHAAYRPVYHHWFYKRHIEGRSLWEPFSMHDSVNLEGAFTSPNLSPDTVVATDGGRFDVNILRRERVSVYWKSEPTEVKRCSWFHKASTDGKYVPFDENVATKLEDEFKTAFETNQWHRKVKLQNGETVIFHGVDVLVLFPAIQSPDTWGNTPQNQPRPRVVKRGMDEFDIEEGESEIVDHLLFMVHGIGAACDLKFRSVEEVVDEFRSIALQLMRSHYRSSCDKKIVNRVEILPVSWHEKLHSAETGIDEKLKSITLESIPKLREFTNDTLLDILFYTSPCYGQTIISSVGNELNRIYDQFKSRNPGYKGGVSLGGHSLGSLILFDILCHQHPPSEPEKVEDQENPGEDGVSPLKETKPHPMKRKMSRRISYMMGSVGTGQPEIIYPHLAFQPLTFFALGSPIGMFVTVRGLDTLGEQFMLPTCPGFFNIFHPYDPVAYRVESLVNPGLADVKPVLIPHHKGRKRMHLELKETMTRVGADLKQKLIDSMKNTWNSVFQLGWANSKQPNLEAEVDKVLQEGFTTEQGNGDQNIEIQNEKTDLCLGVLNKGRRIDYVLQEAPVEFFNEYIFTLSSHLCYWESEDTILMMLKEVYSTLNIAADNQIPQQTMTIERPPPSPIPVHSQFGITAGVDPTAPMNRNFTAGPPPVSGFVRKT